MPASVFSSVAGRALITGAKRLELDQACQTSGLESFESLILGIFSPKINRKQHRCDTKSLHKTPFPNQSENFYTAYTVFDGCFERLAAKSDVELELRARNLSENVANKP